jgi:hypothetical protein
MAIASLMISIFALLVAGASALYTRKQARDSKRIANNDVARRLQERAPVIGLEIESGNNGAWYRLWLRLLDNGPLTDAAVEILEPIDVRFKQGTAGVERGPDLRFRFGRTGTLLIGDDFAWRLEWPDREAPEQIRLKVTCRGSQLGELWSTTRVVEVPRPKRRS